MDKLYATAVFKGLKKFSEVPKTYQAAVKKILKGLVAEGKLSQEDYNTKIKE